MQPPGRMRASHGGHLGGFEAMMQGARRLLNARCDELRARLGDGSSEELEDLLHALKRMDEGTWGRCEKCDGAIGRDRLRALPETRSCLDCATR